ncbi:MAG: branched-chain amino acid aminotransferase, partial [Gemmatimonadetes bacterium]|nr:branched-chain amino acid aminotransferase [Gemmatimonadota bacterium]
MNRDWLDQILDKYALPDNLGFGRELAPLMYRADYRDGRWEEGGLTPYEPIAIDPAATILHYAQQAFEGLKAYRVSQPQPQLFRPELNFLRLLRSSARMCMPELPAGLFAEALSQLTVSLADFIPGGSGQSLYLRPFVMGTGPCLAVN